MAKDLSETTHTGQTVRLLIISNMAHYLQNETIVGHGATAREISSLAQICGEIRHIGCLHPDRAPASALPYSSERVHFIPVPPAGGSQFRDKLRILRLVPLYVRMIQKELPKADVVHVRCPANISLLAIILLALVRHPKIRWIKYAGNWQPNGPEAFSYTFQRWWLKKGFHRGKVTVNGVWPDQPGYVYSFLNPCLTDEELQAGQRYTASKQLSEPIQLLYVGRIESAKGIQRILRMTARLRQEGVQAKLDLIGDGEERAEFERTAQELGIFDRTTFHGWIARADLEEYYIRAHIMLLPSNSEGWPKVLSEAMAYGVVPLASNVGSIPHYLQRFATGKVFAPDDIEAFINAILWYKKYPNKWKVESTNGVQSASLFSYSQFINRVHKMLDI